MQQIAEKVFKVDLQNFLSQGPPHPQNPFPLQFLDWRLTKSTHMVASHFSVKHSPALKRVGVSRLKSFSPT